MWFRGKKYTLSPSGVVFLIVLSLLVAMFLYFYNQPKRVEYVYQKIQEALGISRPSEAPRLQLPQAE